MVTTKPIYGLNPVNGNNFVNAGQSASGSKLTGRFVAPRLPGRPAPSFAGDIVTITLNDKTYFSTVGSEGSWSLNLGAADLASLVDGQAYAITATVTGPGVKVTATQQVTVDRSATLSIDLIDSNGLINASNAAHGIKISGRGTDSISSNLVGRAVAVVFNGKSYSSTIKSDGSWSINVTSTDLTGLSNGQTFSITATATDRAGNVASATAGVVVSTALPVSYTIATAAWDRVRNVEGFGSTPLGAPVTLNPQDASVSPRGTSALNYYVRFTLYNGGVVTLNGSQLFALDGFSLSDRQTLNIGSQSSGAGAGKVTFDPLQLNFSQLGLQPTLFQMLASGTAFKEVDVLGYSRSTNHIIEDYSFGLVAADKLSTDTSGKTQVGLEYGSQEIQQYIRQPDGSYPGMPATAAWDRVRNVEGFGSTPLSAPVTLNPQDASVSPRGASALNYYVRFTLYNGSAVTLNGSQLFALDGFSLSDRQTLNIGSQSSGAGAGKVTFDPLQLNFSQLGLQPTLFQMLASGTAFKEVDVLGYSRSTNHIIEDYSFGLVAADKLSTDTSGKTQVGLEYGSQEIQQYIRQPDGSYPGTPATAAWDRVRNVEGFGSTPLSAPVTLNPQDASVSPRGASALNYYVRFTLYNGSAVTLNGSQLFALDGFSLSDRQTLNIGSQSSGAGAGKVTFDPLQLNFSQLGLQPTLFQMLASGTAFKEVDVLGYSRSTNHIIEDYSFGLVAADKLSTDTSGKTQVGLEYGSQEIQQYIRQPDGSYPGTPATAAWDRVRNVEGFGSTPLGAPVTLNPQDASVSPRGASALNYYVRFTLYNGSAVALNGSQLFALDGFSLSDRQTLNIGSQSSGAGAGKVTFDPLQLNFSQLGLQPTLFQMLASGTAFKEVDVLGYSRSTNHIIEDYSFGLVAADKLSTDTSGKTQVGLEYGSQEIQQYIRQPDGSYPGTPATAAWDRVRNVEGFGSTPLSAPVTLNPQDASVSPRGTSALNYYVRFTLYNGGVVTLNGSQLFALDGFSLSDRQTLNIGSQSSGAGAGKVTFDPLQLNFSQLGLQPTLFQMLASGTAFKEVDVLGYSRSTNHIIEDYSFGLVAADKLSTDTSGKTQVGLEYGSQEIQQYIRQPDGSYLGMPATAAWDRVRNVEGFGSTPLGAPVTLNPQDASVSPRGTSALNYYVRFTLYNGGVVTLNGSQLFALDGFSLSDRQTLNIGSQSSGAGAGKVTFDPLQLNFSQLGLQPTLFQMLASGTAFKEVDVLGYSRSTNHIIEDYSFGLVAADKLSTDTSGKTQVGLEFGSQEIQQYIRQVVGGNATITGASTLEFRAASDTNVSFAPGSTGTLRLDASSQFTGTVAGLALGNYLDLADLSYQGNKTPTINSTGTHTGILIATEGNNTINIALLGSYLSNSFVASSDGHGGTLITDLPSTSQAQLSLSQHV